MDHIKKYVRKKFKDFPKNAEVNLLKQEMIESLEVKYQTFINEGNSQEDALKLVFSDFGDISELKDEYGVNHIKRKRLYQKLFISAFSLFILVLVTLVIQFRNTYNYNSNMEVKKSIIIDQLSQEETFKGIVKTNNLPYIIILDEEFVYDKIMDKRHFIITRFNYMVYDENLHKQFLMPGLALMEYELKFNGEIVVKQFDYLIYNRFSEVDQVKATVSKDKKEIILWGRNMKDFLKYSYYDIKDGKKEVMLNKADYFVQIHKSDSLIDLNSPQIFMKDHIDGINAKVHEQILPTSYFYGMRVYIYDEYHSLINGDDIEDYTIYYQYNNYSAFSLKYGQKLTAAHITEMHYTNELSYDVLIDDELKLFYPKDKEVTFELSNLYKDIEGKLIETPRFNYGFSKRPYIEKEFITINQKQYYPPYNIENRAINLNLKLKVSINDPLKLVEYKVIELDKNANKIKETLIDYKQAKNHLIEYKMSEDCDQLIVYQTFLDSSNNTVTLTKIRPKEELYYLNDQNKIDYFYVIFRSN